MELPPYKNLVPDSLLHRHLEHLLRENGGRVSVAAVCQDVLQLTPSETELAETLTEALIESDPRMQLDGEGALEWVEPSPEEIWQGCQRFAVVDVETTNGSRDDQRIMEVGVCRVEGGEVRREWSALVNPGRVIPYWVQQLTGITDAAVRAAPRLEEILPQLLDELDDTILVAHHARFDVACLNTELSRVISKQLSNHYLCTVELSRHLLPGSRNYRLETLSRWLGLTHERPHRAGSDARATAELFCHLLSTTQAVWSDYLRPHPPARAQIVETKPRPLS